MLNMLLKFDQMGNFDNLIYRLLDIDLLGNMCNLMNLRGRLCRIRKLFLCRFDNNFPLRKVCKFLDLLYQCKWCHYTLGKSPALYLG